MEAVGQLAARGAHVDRATDDGDRPLFLAAYKGHAEVVRLLLAGGAQWDAVDRDGLDALSIARLRGHDETARQLEAHANGRAGSRPDIH